MQCFELSRGHPEAEVTSFTFANIELFYSWAKCSI